MGKSSSKKRERAADEDVADNVDSTILKKTKVDESGKARVTKEAAVEDSVKPKKEKKEKKDKSEKKDKADKEEKAEKKKEKKEKKEKKKEKSIKDDDEAATEELAAADTTVVEEDASPKKSKKDKKEKKEKKVKKDKKEKKSKKSKSEKQDEDESEDKMDIDGDANEPQQNGADEEGQTTEGGKNARFICFIGNLPFTATVDHIKAHFASVHPSSVRLLTDKESKKSKGTCFVEFDRYDHMKTCLEKFHNSEFNDGISEPRKIRVELTAGGGGTTPYRQEKIKEKNKKLNEERLSRMKKEEAAKLEKQQANGATEPAAAEDATADNARPEEAGIHPSRLGRVPFTEGYDENAQDNDYDQGFGGGGGRRGGGKTFRGGKFRGGKGGRGGGRGGGGGRGRGKKW